MQRHSESVGLGGSVADSSQGALEERIAAYLEQNGIVEPRVAAAPGGVPASDLAARIYDLLTSRQFCYLGRTKASAYRERAVGLFEKQLRGREPIRFYYDLGGGYHAGLRPEDGELTFTIGLGEWFVLSQISRFVSHVSELYSAGAVFHIVIDNLCALAVNDIPVEQTQAYVRRLRHLIDAVGLGGHVGVMVESEEFSGAAYLEAVEAEARAEPDVVPAATDLENVYRFLGRRCALPEARERIRRYHAAVRVSDRWIDAAIDGLRMTQRATAGTLSFRPFPGADSRIQTGQVVLTENDKGKLHPMLLTSLSVDRYALLACEFPGELSRILDPVIFAQPHSK